MAPPKVSLQGGLVSPVFVDGFVLPPLSPDLSGLAKPKKLRVEKWRETAREVEEKRKRAEQDKRSQPSKWWAAEFYVVKLTRAKIDDKQCHYGRPTSANLFEEVRTTSFLG